MLLLVSRDLDTVVEYSSHCVVSHLAALGKPLATHRTGKPEPINDKELSGEYPLSLPNLPWPVCLAWWISSWPAVWKVFANF